MHTRNVNVKTAAQESSRKMGGKTVSYTILVAETKKKALLQIVGGDKLIIPFC